MYNQTYEEYMKNVLGYIPSNQDLEYTYRNDANMYYNVPTSYTQNYMQVSNVEDLYPEIYKIVYPMVKKACVSYGREITEENIERITMEIFTNIEEDMNEETRETMQNRKVETKYNSKLEENRNKPENRNRNFLLKDLIRILVLRELVGGNRPQSPSFPELRPPFSGGQGPRPPFLSPIQPRRDFLDQNYMYNLD